MKNNIYNVKKSLRSIAKRYKTVKYSIALVILFLMMGGSALSQEINNTENTIATKEEIQSSIKNLKLNYEEIKLENEKVLKNVKLELIQLMEQGDQVLKSPWSSWQLGANYMSDNWRGIYKGKGDKAEKYPFEGIFTRSDDIFERNLSPLSEKYKKLSISTNPYSASSNRRIGLDFYKYGNVELKNIEEPLAECEVSADINPRKIEKIKPLELVLKHKINFTSPDLPNFLVPDEKAEAVDIPKIKDFPLGNGRMYLSAEKEDYAKIEKAFGEAELVGKGKADAVGPISQTDIKGKDGRGKMEIKHDETEYFFLKTENMVFTGKEGSDHHTTFTYDKNLGYKFKYIREFGPFALRAGGGHDFSIENTDIISSGKVKSSIGNYRNAFYILTLNANTNETTSMTLKNNSTITVNSDKTGAVLFCTYTPNSNLKFTNEGTIKINNQNSFVASFVNFPRIENICTFINKGNINVEGEGGSVILDNVEYPSYYHFINNESIKIAGKHNTGINVAEYGRNTTQRVSVIQLNKPIIVEGDISSAFYFKKLNRNRKFEAVINGNLEKSFFNVELHGKKNTGMRIGVGGVAQNGEVKFQNFKIKSINGEGNNLIKIQKQDDIKFLKGGEHHEFTIEGGDGNLAFYLQESKGIINEGNILIKESNTGVSKNSTGIVSSVESEIENKGKISIKGDRAKGLYALKNGKIINNGEFTFDGNTTNTEKGSIGIYAKQGGKVETNTKSNITVSNPKSVGLFAENKGDDSKYSNDAEINAKNGAFNLYANKGGKITLGDNVILNTEKNSLAFYTAYSSNNQGGKIIFDNTVTANIKKGGTAFYYDLSSLSGNFDFSTWYANNFVHNNNSKLKLNMEDGGRILFLSNGNLTLSGMINNFSLTNQIEVGGNNYIHASLVNSTLELDKDINLDNDEDSYKKLEILSSSIKNSKAIKGSKKGQIAIAQENTEDNLASKIKLLNNSKIELTGEESLGIYGKRAEIDNKGSISVGEKSAAIYLIEDNEGKILAGSAKNNGLITLGEFSSGMVYKAESTGKYPTLDGGIFNFGEIKSTAKNVIGMNFESSLNSKKIINETTGKIELVGENSIGMYTSGIGNYEIQNLGKILMTSSSKLKTPNIGIYTNNKNSLIKNKGIISVGDKSIGIYGYSTQTENDSNISVGNSGIGIYSLNGNLDLKGKLKIGTNEAKGVLLTGNNQIVTNNMSSITLKDNSFGIVDTGNNNKISSSTMHVSLGNKNVFLYSQSATSNIVNNTKVTTNGNGNFGIYTAGKASNTADMDLRKGLGNVGLYSIGTKLVSNSAIIKVGATDSLQNLYSIAMAAGYYDKDSKTTTYSGNIVNTGRIEVSGKYGIGMYASGLGSKAVNEGEIYLTGKASIGMFLDYGAEGINKGSIIATPDAVGAIGAVAMNGAVFKNYGTTNIVSKNGVGVFRKGGILEEYASLSASTAPGSSNISAETRVKTSNLTKTKTEKEIEDGSVRIIAPIGSSNREIEINGKRVTNVGIDTNLPLPDARIIEKTKEGSSTVKIINLKDNEIEKSKASASKLGMYVDTSGVNYTNPIQGLNNLSEEIEVDFILGTEATKYTNSKAIKIKENILKPYNETILSNPQIKKWYVYSGSLTWIGTVQLNSDENQLKAAYLAKIPYTTFAKDKDVYNFSDGLEQRYDKNTLNSREKLLFNKLNGIGKNETILLAQAFDEMMGHQYANTQQRVQSTGIILDKEFKYLREEWRTASKDSNKIKTFGTNGEYKTDTAGVIDYKNNAYGVAYVHEDEDIKLGRGTGWYTGIVHNTFKFKDIGRSKEQMLQAKVGLLKSVPFDDNNSLNWTISGDIFVGHNRMHRKFLVVDEIFNTKSRYYTYGIGVRNEIGKEFRLSEGFTLRPYAALKLEYGRLSKIREKSGEIKLEVKQNQYFSVRPEIGAELEFKHYFGMKALKTTLGVAYENELGKVANGKNKARVVDTTADWFNIRGEKEDRKGNVKVDLNVGLDNTRVGVTANVGYDTKGENLRGGLGLRVIF
ncbi:autotransporter-associated N-terminal domain-containing protein [Fusobacterium canifelinum]|uniref:autotransporter-associated N-terminal domain-containing protein n=1 Tax=Fusobacterium canifelinum TaxID=285729 RepID=UPI0030CCF530